MSEATGLLYVVATPIGNLGDWSRRAVDVLAQVDLIAAEDTRHSRPLLEHYRIHRPLISLHEHNERSRTPELIRRMRAGDKVALISDAGTPLISDPGFFLVRAARAADIRVIPIPGPSAALCALSASGLPTDSFLFVGFLPAKTAARRARLQTLAEHGATLIFYESSHRIQAALADLVQVFGVARQAVIARELTKTFETIHDGTLAELCEFVAADPDQRKGELVLCVAGALPAQRTEISPEAERVLSILLAELPTGQAAQLAAKITGLKKKVLYQRALMQRRS